MASRDADRARKMFIVDDEPSMIALCNAVLLKEGYSVVGSARDGVEAIELFGALDEPADMVLLDHRMPRKSGIETMDDLMRIHPGVKILFISADESIERLAMQKGAVGFLAKPFSISKLVETIKTIFLNGGSGETAM